MQIDTKRIKERMGRAMKGQRPPSQVLPFFFSVSSACCFLVNLRLTVTNGFMVSRKVSNLYKLMG